MNAARNTIELTGAVVSYLEWVAVRPIGLTVVLLHGGGADNAELSWGVVGAFLADNGYRVIAPDHPGFGRSASADWPLTQADLVRYVGELVDALAPSDYVLGGLSLGGGLTLGHLLERPGDALGAMLFGSFGIMPRLNDGPLGGLSHFATAMMLRTGMLAALTRSYSRSASAMERGLREIVRNPGTRTPALVDAVIAEAASGNGMRVFGEWQRDQVRWSTLRTDYTARLASIRTPILLVHGSRDSGVPIARARVAARLLPDARLLAVEGAGHWVQRDRPDVVLPAVRGFLDGLR
jgi:pimeloyl-ACP methyl ester carboxylesterase